MVLKDKEVITLLEKHRLFRLWDMLEDYPEDEVNGRSDWDMLKQELGWLAYKYISDGLSQHESLVEARHILNKTKNGRKMTMLVEYEGNKTVLKTLYTTSDVEWARDYVNEYQRTMTMVKRLKIDY